MSTADTAPTSASALRIVVAAERLFALHGIDGVSLRQISAEAGSANNSAVHYHFGSKHGLIVAIFRHRLPQVINERRLLEARCDPTDLRSRFEAHELPLLNMAETPDNHYVSFVEQIQRRELGSPALVDLPDEGQRSDDQFHRDIDNLLVDVDPQVRRMRVVQAQLFCLHAAADREHALSRGAELPPFALFVSSLFDSAVGLLSAAASEETVRLTNSTGPDTARLRPI